VIGIASGSLDNVLMYIPCPYPFFDANLCPLDPCLKKLTPLCNESAILRSLGLRYIGGLLFIIGQDVEGEKGCQNKETQDQLPNLVNDC